MASFALPAGLKVIVHGDRKDIQGTTTGAVVFGILDPMRETKDLIPKHGIAVFKGLHPKRRQVLYLHAGLFDVVDNDRNRAILAEHTLGGPSNRSAG